MKKTFAFIVISGFALTIAGCATAPTTTEEKERLGASFTHEFVKNFNQRKVFIDDVDGYDTCNERLAKITLKLSGDALCKGKASDCLGEYKNPTPDTSIIARKSDGSRLFGAATSAFMLAAGSPGMAAAGVIQDVIPNASIARAESCFQKTAIVFRYEDEPEEINKKIFRINASWFQKWKYSSFEDFGGDHAQFARALALEELDPKRVSGEKTAYILSIRNGMGTKYFIATEKELQALLEYRNQLTTAQAHHRQ